jgi:hypothetical protein
MKRSHDFDEKACDGLLDLPSNAKVMRTNFSLADLSEVQLADVDLITKVISYCAHSVAQKHQLVRAWIDTHKVTFKGVRLIKYLVQMQMPRDTTLPDSHQTSAIHGLCAELIQDPIRTLVSEENVTVEVQIYSSKNPFVVEYKSITHVVIKQLCLVTYPAQEANGPVKRTRKS